MNESADKRDHGEDGQLDLDASVQMHYGPWSQRYGMVSGLPGLNGPPAVHGLGNWPMVRPHCNSSSVRSPSHRVPVKMAASMRLSVRSTIAVRLA